jgi:uncharacterized OsmC-like protein
MPAAWRVAASRTLGFSLASTNSDDFATVLDALGSDGFWRRGSTRYLLIERCSGLASAAQHCGRRGGSRCRDATLSQEPLCQPLRNGRSSNPSLDFEPSGYGAAISGWYRLDCTRTGRNVRRACRTRLLHLGCGLLGDDTAPNPSEAVLAALGSGISVGIHANAIYRNIRLTKVVLDLEGDINITAVWGTGDTSENKTVGFSAVRVKVHLEGDAPKAELDALIRHADRWSPVANTLRLPVNLTVEPA